MKPWRVPYPKFGAGPGLARIEAIAVNLGLRLPEFGAHGAVIVGSNGKGSTAAITEALLRQTGASVGLFTSPHLFALNERFRCQGKDISDVELERHWARVAAAADETGLSATLGGFEFLFLIAADWFAARGCTHTIWEAGIGGRLDPVRLIEARRLALTSLDLEHTELLGDTLAAIARDKLDAAPRGARVMIGASCASEREVIETHCLDRGIDAMWAKSNGLDGTLALQGLHQRDNAVLAEALAHDMAGAALTKDLIALGLAEVRWPGRLEVIQEQPLVVIDVGHTPRAIAAALAGFERLRRGPSLLVCGASYDKKAGDIVAALARGFSLIICAAARHKGAPASEIAAYAALANPDAEIVIAGSVAEAHAVAFARAEHLGGCVYVAGGLFLAAEFKAVHLGRDPASLVFF